MTTDFATFVLVELAAIYRGNVAAEEFEYAVANAEGLSLTFRFADHAWEVVPVSDEDFRTALHCARVRGDSTATGVARQLHGVLEAAHAS